MSYTSPFYNVTPRLELIGFPQLVTKSKTVDLSFSQTNALLIILTLEGKVSKKELGEKWGEQSAIWKREDTFKKAKQRLVKWLKSTDLAKEVLISGISDHTRNMELNLSCDLIEFHAHATYDRYREALALVSDTTAFKGFVVATKPKMPEYVKGYLKAKQADYRFDLENVLQAVPRDKTATSIEHNIATARLRELNNTL